MGQDQDTVEPPVSDHPKCQEYVVGYGRSSLTGSQGAKI